MVNMSLARIMYGTNADVHVPDSMNPVAFSARIDQPAHDGAAKGRAVPAHALVGKMLRKAWTALIKN